MITFQSPDSNKAPFVAKPGMALILLFSICAFFMILTPGMTGFLGRMNVKAEAVLKIAMILQDVFVFITPAVLTAMVATRLPARLLAVDTFPRLSTVALSLMTLLCAVPALNAIIVWNESLSLPESMAGVEQLMRQLEENAKAVTDSLMSGASVPSLILSIMIVGVFAGFSEELFFRGAMQRVLTSTMINTHLAVWIVAFVFSLFHFQFFGFVPRMLLGAYFGYLLIWTRSLWVPIITHIFNNSVVVIATWRSVNNPETTVDIDKIGTDLTTTQGIVTALASVILTVICLIVIKKRCAIQQQQ